MSGLAKATGQTPFPLDPESHPETFPTVELCLQRPLIVPFLLSGDSPYHSHCRCQTLVMPDTLLVCCCPLVLSVGTGSGSLSSQFRRCLLQEGTLGFKAQRLILVGWGN